MSNYDKDANKQELKQAYYSLKSQAKDKALRERAERAEEKRLTEEYEKASARSW